MYKQAKLSNLILGIVAVVLLHLGFVFYITSNRPPETDSAVRTPAIGTSLRVTPESAIQPDDDTVLLADEGEPSTDVGADIRGSHNDSFWRPQVFVARHDVRHPVRAGVRSQVITVKNPRVIITTFEQTMAEARKPVIPASLKEERIEKRSLISRVVPVIKKPYDWLKAIGSKMR